MQVTYKGSSVTIENTLGKVVLYSTDAVSLAKDVFKQKEIIGGKDDIEMLMIILQCSKEQAERLLAEEY